MDKKLLIAMALLNSFFQVEANISPFFFRAVNGGSFIQNGAAEAVMSSAIANLGLFGAFYYKALPTKRPEKK